MAEMTIREILSDDKLVKRVSDADGDMVYETLDNCVVLLCDPDDIQINKYTRVGVIVDHGTYADVFTGSTGDRYSPEETLTVLR